MSFEKMEQCGHIAELVVRRSKVGNISSLSRGEYVASWILMDISASVLRIALAEPFGGICTN